MLKIKHKVKLVLGISVEIISVAGAIICAIIALQSKGELQEIDQYIETNVNGDNNTININNISDLVREYNNLSDENKSLREQNTKYFNDLMETQNQLDYVSNEMADAPEIVYKDLALMIDAVDKPINSSNAMITIDGRDYATKEIIEQLIPKDKDMTIKDNTLFVGQVVADKAKLSDQFIKSNLSCRFEDSIQDSFGFTHNDCMTFNGGIYGSAEIEFSLQNKFNYLNCELSVYGNYIGSENATITIKADGNIIKSFELTEDTETIIVEGLSINNCSVLAISKTGSDGFGCVISNAIVYN